MNILFMCVANSARSQMAERLARNMFGDKARVESAGSAPKNVNPLALEVMKEIGIDIGAHRSKSFEELPADFVKDLDYVVTLCAEEVCPMVKAPHAKRLHWGFPDPAQTNVDRELQLEAFRNTRDGLKARLIEFQTAGL